MDPFQGVVDKSEQRPLLPEGESDLQEGFERGKELAQQYTRQVLGWAKENPGLALAAAAGAGFVLGRLLSPSRD